MYGIGKKWMALLFLLLTACVGPQLYHGQLVALNLGMAPDSTVQKLGLPPLSTHKVSVDGKEFLFHHYDLNNGMNADLYLLAFENGQLKYWGYIDDFKRHPDPELNKAVDALLSDLHPHR